MLEINIPNKFSKSLTTDKIEYIVNSLYWNEKYNVNFIDRSIGNYLTIESEKKIAYIILTASSWEVEWRNSFLSQFLSTVIDKYELDNNIDKELCVFLLNTTEYAKTDYNIFIYRCILTYWIKIINLTDLWLNLSPFNSFQDFLNSRKSMIRNNNNSSFFEELQDSINFYLKVFWANWKEAVFLALVISVLSKSKPIVIFQVLDNEAISISETDKSLLERHNIFIDDDKLISEYINSWSISKEKIWPLRKTWKFHSNLLKKFWEKKCYLCWCTIDKTIIWSHIHRVTDIENDSTLNTEDKIKQIIDWDNWFWLCANHDKLFEYWIIYFDNKKLNINNKLLEEIQENFIKDITINFEINDVHYNDNISNYLKKHKNRVLI